MGVRIGTDGNRTDANVAVGTREVPTATPPQMPPTGLPTMPEWMRLPAFRDLPKHAIDRIVEVMEPRFCDVGQPLMTQGDPGDGLLVLIEGSVLVTVREDGLARTGHEPLFVRSLNAPVILGEAAVLTGEPRTATVTAVTPCKSLFMDAETLRTLCMRYPSTAMFLSTLVGERLLASDSIKTVGKYTVRGRLGSGGMATVFSAAHPDLGRDVALKMLAHSLTFDRTFSERFAREARLVAQLDHENIVRVFDTERAYGTQFIVMEKLEGDVLQPPRDGLPVLAWSAIRRILVQILDALSYSHARGLIHRDIKPSNVFMTRTGKVKLLDFGIAAVLGSTGDTGARLSGTPAYVSPEQCTGETLDGRSDLYSVGLLAYELCTGKRPFWESRSPQEYMTAHMTQPTPDPRLLAPDMPDDLVEFILRATKKKPADRFASCTVAADFLQSGHDVMAEAHGVATLAVSYPLARQHQVNALLAELAERLTMLRGVQVASGTDQAQGPTQPEQRAMPTSSENTQITQMNEKQSSTAF